MYTLQAEASFDAAHFLKGYEGKCKNLHGHRWRVVVSVCSQTLQPSGSEAGMLMDFGHIKNAVKSLCDSFDHAFLVEEGSLRPETQAALEAEGFRMVFFPFRTTAENLSRYICDVLRQQGLLVREVAVYETPTNRCTYTYEEGNVIVKL